MATPHEILKDVWGYDAFRPLQEEIIESVLQGKDTLALLPTGGGKSICFQVPGLVKEGLTLVISPLIALMRDQVSNLNQRGIAATFINSTMDFRQIDRKLQNAIAGKYKFLYCAPERLRTDMLVHRLPKMNVSLLAVDEAHCVSQWGYDFRPAYQEIKTVREILPKVPVIALTATATEKVAVDIQEHLEMKNPGVFMKSFKRDNLAYKIIRTDNPVERCLQFVKSHAGTGIIYARTRKRTLIMAELLEKAGISSAAYHGGMLPDERNAVQEAWLTGQKRVIAATNAFGMGIDKPDVRFVAHINLPLDLESYYQEAGRAGRDGKYAEAIAFDTPKDKGEVKRWVTEKYPTWEQLVKHYNALCDYYQIPNVGPEFQDRRFDIKDIAKSKKLAARLFYNSVKILDREGLVVLNESPDRFGEIRLRIGPDAVLHYKNKYPQWEEMLDYILRQFGGVIYSESKRFLPSRWANGLQRLEAELEEELKKMMKQGILFYRPPVTFPTIRFLMHRHKLSRMELNWHKYNFLMDQGLRRKDKLLEYVEADQGCRSLLLQTYFGEQTTEVCGKCDLCLDRLKMEQSSEHIAESIREEILAFLDQGAMGYAQLIQQVEAGTEEQRDAVLRHLLDRRQVEVDLHSQVSLIESP